VVIIKLFGVGLADISQTADELLIFSKILKSSELALNFNLNLAVKSVEHLLQIS